MSSQEKRKRKLSTFFTIPLILGALLTVITILVYFIYWPVGMILTVFLVVYFAFILVLYRNNSEILRREMVDFATQYGQVQKEILRSFDVPYALLDESARILWMNDAFQDVVHGAVGYGKSVTKCFPALRKEILPADQTEVRVPIDYEGTNYTARLHRIPMEDMLASNTMLDDKEQKSALMSVFLVDDTAARIAIREVDDQSVVIGFIYIDNYEEAVDPLEDVRKSLLVALIDRKVTKYISSIDGICSKIEKDKFLVVLRKKSLHELQAGHFDVLEDVKKVSVGNEIAVTLSLGFGVDGLAYAQNYEFARNAVDLALGRGGDQAVVKSPDNIVYYGGKTRQVEKNTRVKARVKAQALKEIIRARDSVFIMGHKMGDPDSFGAAVGIYRIARTLGKKAYIVINERTISIEQVLRLFDNNPEYGKDFILTSAQALEAVTDNACVVVVDVNSPARTECPELLTHSKSIVVLDHHRAGKDVIEGATLSYVEAFASSACEMVAEIVQYTGENIRLHPEEADAMYGGIVVDTDGFVNKAGVRTFEAAAFLRRSGADVVRVRKMFREEAADYKAKADAVSQAEIYRDFFAFSVCNGEGLRSPTVVAAQAANQLLNIDRVKASFVLTQYNGQIFVSARSIDEINVQIIMEHLGGGGHINMAGCQMTDITVEECIEKVKKVIDEMIEGGEIDA